MKTISKPLMKAVLLSFFTASLSTASAQTGGEQEWSNPVMIVLASVALVLLIVLVFTGALLSSVLKYKYGKKPEVSLSGARVLPMLILPFLFFSSTASAASASSLYGGVHPLTFYFLLAFIFLEMILITVFCVNIMHALSSSKGHAVKKVSLVDKLNASVSIGRESEIMLDHDYDGIRELDNDLPPWWKYGFYLSIVFAVVYLVHYHVAKSGQLQLAEYNTQIQEGDEQVKAYKMKSANLVDEENLKPLTEAAALTAGKETYTANCAACHGQKGEGTVGPNLTDEYWMHGGSMSLVFKSIKYGWPEKGMKAWEKDLGAKKIHEVASYINSLKGSTPPNAKEKQGEIYNESAPADTVVNEIVMKQN